MRTLSMMAFLAALSLAACATAGGEGEGSPRRDPTRITETELDALPSISALEAVERLRPAWLRSRVTSLGGGGAVQYFPQVMVDGIQLGSLDALRTLNVRNIREMRFLSPADATTQLGTGFMGGAIQVFTKSG